MPKMTETQRTVAQETERYLRTGESDPYRSAWSGGFLQREKRAHDIFATRLFATSDDSLQGSAKSRYRSLIPFC